MWLFLKAAFLVDFEFLVMGSRGFRIAELSRVVVRISWCLFVLATVGFAAPSPQNTPTPTGNAQACAQISPATAAFLAQNPAGESVENSRSHVRAVF